jgi:hypothetical protein
MKFLVFIASTLFLVSAHAGLYGELNGFYNTDNFTTATSATYSKTYYALDIHSNLENKNRFYGGFHVDQVSFSEQSTPATTTTLTSLNMGPMLMWIMDHKKTYSLAVGYNVLAKGSYSVTGSQSAELSGSSLWGSLGIMPEIADNWFVGFRITYYNLTYTKSTTGSAATDVSYSRGLIFPTFGLAWRY